MPARSNAAEKKKKIQGEENPEIRLQDTCACLLRIRLTHARKVEKEKIRSDRCHLSDAELISKSHKGESQKGEHDEFKIGTMTGTKFGNEKTLPDLLLRSRPVMLSPADRYKEKRYAKL